MTAPAGEGTAAGGRYQRRRRIVGIVGTIVVVGGLGVLLGCLHWRDVEPLGSGEALAQIQDARIREASGIAASHRYPGDFYVHNDSGDSARVFLIDSTGATRAEIRLRGATARDCEDIAVAPGADGGWDVCLADIGDNNAKRDDIVVYRFAEPNLPATTNGSVDVTPAVFHLRYEHGPANAEGFAVDPRTGDGYILTKHPEGFTQLYYWPAPWDASKTTELRRLAKIELPPGLEPARLLTAADIAPDGRALVIRTYAAGWWWDLPADASASAVAAALEQPPRLLELTAEPQGEALAFTMDGTALVTISEGRKPLLYRYERPASDDDPNTPATQP